MSSSSQAASTEAVNPDVPAPIGWTSDKAYMYGCYWLGNPGDTKYMLSVDYGLAAKPIWTRHPKYNDVLYIFEASPSVGKASYYVWNAITSVCIIDAAGIDEIRDTINRLGKGVGYLRGLKLTVLD
jgi:hypothetical protein